MDLVSKDHTRRMTDRERKKKTAHHEDVDEQGESDLQIMMRYMLEESKRAEARRESEAKRAEARLIAAEERAEARRREDKIAEEERAEARRLAAEEKAEERAEAKRLRQLEEDRRAEEKEAAKEEAARLASERVREQQEVANARAYEQQVALVKLQSEIGDRAAEAHRRDQEVHRKRERAVSGIASYREREDVEDFLSTSERKLKAGGVPEGEWLSIIASKLGGKVGSTWHDLSEGKEYYDVKAGLLRVCGYTPKLAGEMFYGFKAESLKGVSGDQLYNRGVQLIRRMVAPQKLTPEMEFGLLKPWVWSVVPKKARLGLDSRAVNTAGELIEALQNYLVMEGERTEGQAAVFGRQSFSGEGSRDRMAPLTCFTCGKQGHKAVDCWSGSSSSPYQPGSGSGGAAFSITCFTCGEPGHKSTQCPSKEKNGKGGSNLLRQVKAEPKEVPARQVNRLRGHPSRDTVLDMIVNGQAVPVLLDSGSAITVVPGTMVAQAQQTGETVELRGFAARETPVLPLAEIPFEIDKLCWKEIVALAPAEAESEVVYGLDLVSSRGLELVYLANRRKLEKEVSTGGGKLAADRPVSGPAPVVNETEEIEEEEVGFVVEGEEEEGTGKIYRLRRLDIVDCSKDLSEPGVVGGDRKRLEAPLHPSHVSIDCCNQSWFSTEPQTDQFLEQQEQQRTASVLLVGGDVGTAHRRRKKEKEKEKKEDKEEEHRTKTFYEKL